MRACDNIKIVEALDHYLGGLRRRNEILPNSADILKKRTLFIGNPASPGEALGWLADYMENQGAVFLNPSLAPDDSEPPFLAVCRRFAPDAKSADALYRELAAQVAGTPAGHQVRAVHAALRGPLSHLTGEPAMAPHGQEVVQAALFQLEKSGALERGFNSLGFAREHFVLGQNGIASAYDRISRVLAARYGVAVPPQTTHRLAAEARGEQARIAPPLFTLFGSARPADPNAAPADLALSGKLL